jgi:serine/threonine-protein kinase
LVPAPDYDPLADPLLGRLIDDRYSVIRVLGEGGMGTVYEVRHDKLERHFALKALRRDLARDPELSARFIQEARATAAVSHPGIVQITDFGTLDTGQPYFVMELLRGQPLTALLRDEAPLGQRRALTIVCSLADALRAAHRSRIIHRDLKPDNIQVLRSASGLESVKILDFGLARVGSGSRLTKEGFVFGTPHYMSPEQASGEAIDHRADMYSLGILMYELFTSQLPFQADTSMGVLTQHIYRTPVPPAQVAGTPVLDRELERIILRCLEKLPEKRFKDLDEVLGLLENVEASLAQAAGVPSVGRRESEGRLLNSVSEPPRILEIGWVNWLAGAAGLAALALAGAILLGPSGDPPEAPAKKNLQVRSLQPPTQMAADAPTPTVRTRASPAHTASPSAAPPEPPAQAQATAIPAPGRAAPEPVAHTTRRPQPAASLRRATKNEPTEPSAPAALPPRAAPPSEVIDPWAQ